MGGYSPPQHQNTPSATKDEATSPQGSNIAQTKTTTPSPRAQSLARGPEDQSGKLIGTRQDEAQPPAGFKEESEPRMISSLSRPHSSNRTSTEQIGLSNTTTQIEVVSVAESSHNEHQALSPSANSGQKRSLSINATALSTPESSATVVKSGRMPQVFTSKLRASSSTIRRCSPGRGFASYNDVSEEASTTYQHFSGYTPASKGI